LWPESAGPDALSWLFGEPVPQPGPSAPSPLEEGLGHRFQDLALLRAALTPPSAGLPEDNQRLEFLGDSVLHLCVSVLVYREHPQWAEGALSKLRGLLVCTDALHQWAKDLGIELGRGPRSPRKPGAVDLRNPLADAVEALLAAVFLDVQAGGGDAFGAVQAIVERRFLQEVREAYVGIWEARDSKTTLQERAAALTLPPPVYELVGRTGPDHAPSFTVQVSLGERAATATAGTLKRAQTEAARALLLCLQCLPSL
jgi:ribonuclease-3